MNKVKIKLIQERQNLDQKIIKLEKFIDNLDYQLKPLTSEEFQYIGAMIEQLRVMEQYSEILTKRITLLNNNDMSYFNKKINSVK